MPSTFTTNKLIEQPASGSYDNAWAAPVNADWAIIDAAFGGSTSINVTGVVGGTYSLTPTQFQPPNISFVGALTANLAYQLPAGVGGIWSVYNGTTLPAGPFTLYFTVQSGGFFVLPPGQRSLIISDGTNISSAQTLVTAFSQLTGQVSNAQVPQSAVTQWQSALAILFSQLSGVAAVGQIPGLPASQITSGTFANAQIAQSNVTQWQSALAVAFTQLTGIASVGQIPGLPGTQLTSGTVNNAQISQASVTQWQTALAIAFTQLTGAATVAQLPANAYRGSLGSGVVTVQSGGVASGGNNGDIFLIY